MPDPLSPGLALSPGASIALTPSAPSPPPSIRSARSRCSTPATSYRRVVRPKKALHHRPTAERTLADASEAGGAIRAAVQGKRRGTRCRAPDAVRGLSGWVLALLARVVPPCWWRARTWWWYRNKRCQQVNQPQLLSVWMEKVCRRAHVVRPCLKMATANNKPTQGRRQPTTCGATNDEDATQSPLLTVLTTTVASRAH